jgi:antitoxin component of MazEF toxin-antitoxin module
MKKHRMIKTKRLLNLRGSQAVVLPKEWLSLLGAKFAIELELEVSRQRIIIRASSGSR